MNTSYIYMHRYPCHGSHHFPTETIYGESSSEDSICHLMLSESDPMLTLFNTPDLDPCNLSCEDLLAAGSQDSQGKDGKFECFFPPFSASYFATQLCDLLVSVWASGY